MTRSRSTAAPGPATSTSTWARTYTVPFNFTAGSSNPAQVKSGQNVEVPAGTDGADREYGLPVRRCVTAGKPEPGDAELRQPRHVAPDHRTATDYSNPSLWRQVNVDSNPLQVEAYVINSGVSAATTYTLTAASDQSINALVLALSAAVAGGTGVGVSVAGSGVYTGNVISTDVQAYQDGDGSGPGAGVHATSVSFSATDSFEHHRQRGGRLAGRVAGRRRGGLGIHRYLDRTQPDRQRRGGVHRQRRDGRVHHQRRHLTHDD